MQHSDLSTHMHVRTKTDDDFELVYLDCLLEKKKTLKLNDEKYYFSYKDCYLVFFLFIKDNILG